MQLNNQDSHFEVEKMYQVIFRDARMCKLIANFDHFVR